MKESLHTLRILLEQEFRMEFRRPSAVWAVALYLGATILVCFQVFGPIKDPDVFSALFWIIMIFNGLYASTRSFSYEKPGRQLYLYFMVSPILLVFARMLWAVLSGWVFALGGLLLFFLFLGGPEQFSLSGVCCTILAGTMGINIIMTFISAISARVNQGHGMAAILGLPLLLPVLVIAVTGFGHAMAESERWIQYLGMLLAISAGSGLAGTVLFPYIWRD